MLRSRNLGLVIPDGSGNLSAVANPVTLDDARNSDGLERQLLKIKKQFSSSVEARERTIIGPRCIVSWLSRLVVGWMVATDRESVKIPVGSLACPFRSEFQPRRMGKAS